MSVGVGTALLAIATAYMAWAVRVQARETTRLANTAEQQLAATTTPVVRLMRTSPGYGDIVTVNAGASDEALVVRVENQGAAAAELESFALTPGGSGTLAEIDTEPPPTLRPGGEWDVDFHPDDAAKEHYARGDETLLQIIYLGLGSGARYRLRTYVKREMTAGPEAWRVLREEGPTVLGSARSVSDAC